MIIEQGTPADIDELEQLYNDLNDHLEQTVNYSGWKKGVYPLRQHAEAGIAAGTLYVARDSGKIAGSFILNHIPEPAYSQAVWRIEADYSDIVVVHTFAVHPAWMNRGIGRGLMDFADTHSRRTQTRAIRLDVYEGNLPAIRLYEKCGFHYIGTVDLGLGQYGLYDFRLYEKLL